jgi:ATP-dependent exoDNAse (exonuclease V) alpha subunit
MRKMTDDQLSKQEAPLLVVYGGGGTGKSTLIKTIANWTEATFCCDDDRHPDQPFIVLTAPTGTAAKNIKGLTLHSAFNMPFGNDFINLGNKKHDQKRHELSRFRILIVDEMSMVKADMLYQLNLWLKEIKQNDKDFGDLMQLRPVQARYIFQTPKNEKFALSHVV